jgi:hypothetical protein
VAAQPGLGRVVAAKWLELFGVEMWRCPYCPRTCSQLKFKFVFEFPHRSRRLGRSQRTLWD